MNDIQQKLNLIDKQLSNNSSFSKQLITKAPLTFIAFGLISGIIIQNTFHMTVSLWAGLLFLCTLSVAGLLLIALNRYNKSVVMIAYIVFTCSLCLGAIRLTNYTQPKQNDIRHFLNNQKSLATVRGILITEPYINKKKNWKFAKFSHKAQSTSFYLKLTELKTTSGWAKVTGTIRAQVTEPVFDLRSAVYIQAYCWLDKFKPASNPGQFNMAEYMARRNVHVAAYIKSRDAIELLKSGTNNFFAGVQKKVRQIANLSLFSDNAIEESNQGLLEALLLGYRSNIDSDVYRIFEKTGLLHFISLSGMHLGILIGIVWWLCKTTGLLKPARAIICIITVGVFLLVVPPRSPTLRAAIISILFCLSVLFRRRTNPINTLSLAAIILLLIRPTELFEPGWQLSFASVLGILFFHQRISNSIYRILPKIPKPCLYFPYMCSVGLAAWLSSAGILLYHFHTISPLTWLWTVLVFPLVAVILIIGFLKIILSFLLPTLSAILAVILNSSTDMLIWLVKLFANFDISELLIGKVNGAVIVIYYVIIISIFFLYLRRPFIKKLICSFAIIALISFLGFSKWQRTYRDNLIFSCLDVGHGQTILVQLPGRRNFLFDAGSLSHDDIGNRIVTPFLRCNGIDKLDAVFISHYDIDHINGIPEIAENCKIAGLYENCSFANQTKRKSTEKFLKNYLQEKSLEIYPLDRSTENIKFLWPNEKACQDSSLSDNDKSTVSIIEFAGRNILLCSDIQNYVQKELLELHSNLKADIIVLPHHGSTKTLESEFIQNLEPQILICSCGQKYYEKQQVNATDTKTFYTAKSGAITISIDKKGKIEVKTFIK